jgi:hypothetical protein
MKTPEEIKAQLIEVEGDQAYWRAVSIIGTALFMKDLEFAQAMADAAKLLMAEGYHKHPEAIAHCHDGKCCGM